MRKDMLDIGRKYKIEFDDCCVQGHITGVVKHWFVEDEWLVITLDTGVVGGFVTRILVTEVDPFEDMK
jgi:hypothetical protein